MARISFLRKNCFVSTIISFCCISFSLSALSETTENEKSEIKYFKPDNITNQIPYFDNRFQIDAELDEVTLLFYRVSGTQPIILVRPDGSKLRVNNYPKEKVEWFDDRTFDMIKIKKPMPGPWQAIGNILPNSQIMVVSDVRIEVDPLPAIVLSGETLKIEGKLFNGEKAIDIPDFRDVIQLDVDFFSTNNSVYENFGADPIKLASFRDDGRDLDEYSGDNIFTGEFELNFAPGEWTPIYYVKLPMATRELKQSPIVLQPSPIKILIEHAEAEGQFHKMNIAIDPTFVDPDSLIFQGKITFPDKQVEPFSIMEGAGTSRVNEFPYTEPGIHRINLSAFGKTINGREFRLVVDENSFNVKRKEDDFLADIDNVEGSAQVGEPTLDQEQKKREELQALQFEATRIEQIQAQEEQKNEAMILIVVGNGLIIVVGVIAFFIIRSRKVKGKA